MLYANHHRVNTPAAYYALRAHGYRNVRCYPGGLADCERPATRSRAPPWATAPTVAGLMGTARMRGGAERRLPHCDNGWSGSGWPLAPSSRRAESQSYLTDEEAHMAEVISGRYTAQPDESLVAFPIGMRI
jgi:hypothetical protein